MRGIWKLTIFIFIFILIGVGILLGVKLISGINSGGEILGSTESVKKLNIYTTNEGLYRIKNDELEKIGFFVDPENSSRLRLTWRGEAQPLWVLIRESVTLLFYAQRCDSIYVEANVYQLSLENSSNPQTKILEVSTLQPTAQVDSSSSFYLELLELEENHIYNPTVIDGDHWLWNAIPATKEQSYQFKDSNVGAGMGQVILNVWGNTESPVTPDHHVVILLNDQVISEQTWDGSGWHDLVADFSTEVLRGENKITISSPGDTGALVENIYINKIQINYPRQPIVRDGFLKFIASDKPIIIKGLSGIILQIDITNLTLPEIVDAFSSNVDGFLFDGIVNHSYLIVSEYGWLAPHSIEASLMDPVLQADNQGADYIAIGFSELLQGLEPLIQFRREQGLDAISIPVQAIYDQFNYGFNEPQAIKLFIEYTTNNWDPAPRYILLVGDTTYDSKGYISQPPPYNLPTFFVQTKLGGETASDVLYGMWGDTGDVRLAIGRIPARSKDDVEVWIRKVLQVEQVSGGGISRKNVFAIADSQEKSFILDAEYFLTNFQGDFITDLYTPNQGEENASSIIIDQLRNGIYMLSYFGHGSINMWGKQRIFTIEDINNLTDQVVPIVLQMTCLTGLFTHPEHTSMTEALLFQENSGAASVIAPTSLTLSFNQTSFSQGLALAFNDGQVSTIGDAFLFAQRYLIAEGERGNDVLLTFLLFGDPAFTLKH